MFLSPALLMREDWDLECYHIFGIIVCLYIDCNTLNHLLKCLSIIESSFILLSSILVCMQ